LDIGDADAEQAVAGRRCGADQAGDTQQAGGDPGPLGRMGPLAPGRGRARTPRVWLGGRSHPRCILREVSSEDTDARIIGVIGQCSVSACSRQAARYLVIRTRRSNTISGVVCEHCAQATASAAFLLDLLA
jgi:hypothetical protein